MPESRVVDELGEIRLKKKRVKLNLLCCCVLVVFVFAELRWEKIISIDAFSR